MNIFKGFKFLYLYLYYYQLMILIHLFILNILYQIITFHLIII